MMPRRLSIAILISAAASLAGCAKSPESVVESFYKAIGKGKVEEATGYLSQSVVLMLGPKKLAGALMGEAEKANQCGGFKNIQSKLSGDGDFRFGNVTVEHGGNCPARKESVKLIKEDGAWKIAPNK